MAKYLYGIATALAFSPAFEVLFEREEVGFFHILTATSPWTVALFLMAAALHSWFHHSSNLRENGRSVVDEDMHPNIHVPDSSGAIVGVYAGITIVVNQGISENMLQAILSQNPQSLELAARRVEVLQPPHGYEDLVWNLIDNIKSLRRRMEIEQVANLNSQLEALWLSQGSLWPLTLRRESLLLLAEHEKMQISLARNAGTEFDVSILRTYLSEIKGLDNV